MKILSVSESVQIDTPNQGRSSKQLRDHNVRLSGQLSWEHINLMNYQLTLLKKSKHVYFMKRQFNINNNNKIA